jgi:DNA-binding XRE family transcriptional regulator
MALSAPQHNTNEIRGVRLRLQLSQPGFAALLGVSAETYRTWDSGRRLVPDAWLDKARALAATNDPQRLWSLQQLATELGVHVRTLRDAARNGRLEVSYETRVVFRNLIPRLPDGVLISTGKGSLATSASCSRRISSTLGSEWTGLHRNTQISGRYAVPATPACRASGAGDLAL